MKYLIYALLIISSACNKNPYPESGVIKTQPQAKPEPVRAAISADLPDNIEFKEGSELSVTFRAVVPKPGKPVMKFDDLPQGAEFNPETLTLKWTPDYFSGNASDDPSVKVKVYPVVVWVRSSEDNINAIRKSMNLIVYDVPRNITVNSDPEFTVNEGEAKSYKFKIENLDYTTGPFDVSLNDFPVNALLEKINNNEYQVKFAPDYQHVNVVSDTRCSSYLGACREYTPRILVSNPAGHKFEKSFKAKVIDKRIAPKAVAVDRMEQGLDVNFQIGGYDLNSEVTPQIKLISSKPTVGTFKMEETSDAATYSSALRISWLDLPPALNGTSHNFNFEVCALDKNEWYKNCVTKSIQIDIKVRERLAPIISRSSWSVGDMKYLNFKESATYRVDVVDAHNSRAPVKVEITPEEIRKYVSWNRNQLSVKFDKAGIYQFNVNATSEYGIKSIEGFVVEVFPETRGQVIYLSDSSRDKEVQFYRKQFTNVEVINPFLQELGTRLLAGRHTLVVGTSVLADPASMPAVLVASKAIKNLVIASPMVNNLPEAIYRQITEDFKITIVGRYLDIPRAPLLKDLSFVKRQDFETPKNFVSLAQVATTESINPVIFSTGVDTKNCDDVLEIADVQKLYRYKIGVICDRPSAGRLALLGTEWADLKAMDPQDEQIAFKWLNKMLTAGLNDVSEEF